MKNEGIIRTICFYLYFYLVMIFVFCVAKVSDDFFVLLSVTIGCAIIFSISFEFIYSITKEILQGDKNE